MYVVRHQDVRMHGATALSGSLGQAFKIKAAVDFSEETGRAIDAALADVQRHIGKFQTRRSRHEGSTHDPRTGLVRPICYRKIALTPLSAVAREQRVERLRPEAAHRV